MLVPQITRFLRNCNFSWTRIFANSASVPKNAKNVFVRTRISQSKLLRRDESIRKKGFCAETGQPDNRAVNLPRNHATRQPDNRASAVKTYFSTLRIAASEASGNSSLALVKIRSAETFGSSLYALVTCSYPQSSSGFW